MLYFRRVTAALLFTLLTPASRAQSTQGVIAGRVLDSATGHAISAAQVSVVNEITGSTAAATTGQAGHYVVPQLSPGTYRLRVSLNGYQAQEVHELELHVAGRIDLDFLMRPVNEVW